MLTNSFTNLVVRGLSVVLKFSFLLYLGRFYSVGDVGFYGLLTTTVGISVYIVGLEFYTFSTREIVSREQADQVVFIRDQLVFHGLSYLVILPPLLVVFPLGVLPWNSTFWFFLLVVCEHLAQESARLFITLSRPIFSNVMFFIRSSAWVVLIYAAHFLRGEAPPLSFVWAVWALGASVSLAISWANIRRMDWSVAKTRPIDWSWIKRGYRVASPFLAGTMAYKVMEVSDRYFIKAYYETASVGVYSFFGTLSNIVGIVTFTGIVSIMQPSIMAAFQKGDLEAYRAGFRRMTVTVVGALGLLLPALAVGVYPVLWFVGKLEYAREVAVFWVLLLSAGMFILGTLPQFALYVRKEDRAILIGNIIGAILNSILNFVLIPRYENMGAALATGISFLAVFAYYLYKLTTLKKSGVTP